MPRKSLSPSARLVGDRETQLEYSVGKISCLMLAVTAIPPSPQIGLRFSRLSENPARKNLDSTVRSSDWAARQIGLLVEGFEEGLRLASHGIRRNR